MARPPEVSIDLAEFTRDPYPTLAWLRAETPIAFVKELNSIVFSRRDDIWTSEKQIEIFSSDQPDGLMTKLMGQNMMRKDGQAHLAERAALFPAVSPKTVKAHWRDLFQADANTILDALQPSGQADLVRDYALPLSGEALKHITGLTNITYQEMDAWSQGMIDGIANYTGDPVIEARCHDATSSIDAAIDDMVPVLRQHPDKSMLGVLLHTDMPMESIRANIKLTISGGQNEPRDAIAGAIWALLTHADQLAMVRTGEVSWLQVFEEYARWISPIGMSPRRVAQHHTYNDIDFEPEDRVFFLFGSANRDEAYFTDPDSFDLTRDTGKSIAFGAGPHFCAGAAASRSLIAEVALPTIFARLKDLRLAADAEVVVTGWAFRGLLNLPVVWDT